MSAKISRRTATRVLSVAVGSLPHLPAAPQRREKLFAQEQMEAVAALAETIIPTTTTPGARAAKVHEYIDRTLAGNDAQAETFLAGLKWVEDASAQRYGKGFARLDPSQQTELLTRISDTHTEIASTDRPGAAFFRQLKVMVCNGYYLSRIGLEQEVRYRGNTAIHDYPSCGLHEQ